MVDLELATIEQIANEICSRAEYDGYSDKDLQLLAEYVLYLIYERQQQ